MITVLEDFVNGPFDLETPYKGACVAKLQSLHRNESWICLETSETESGMPDTVRLGGRFSQSILIEYKVSDAAGVIRFKKDQPRWYKRHQNLTIYVIAWDKRYNRSVLITDSEIIANGKLSFHIPEDIELTTELESVRRW